MIQRSKFDEIKDNFGHYASWGIWAEEGLRPKDNTGDLSVLDPDINTSLLQDLNPNIILVGLNISGRIKTPLGNFHSPDSKSQDYKIRYALKNTTFWGGYMTDIIKDFEQKFSGKMMQHLRHKPEFEHENIKTFLEELEVIGAKNPKIIAFGNDAFSILKKHLSHLNIYKVTHYSAAISKENLRKGFEQI